MELTFATPTKPSLEMNGSGSWENRDATSSLPNVSKIVTAAVVVAAVVTAAVAAAGRGGRGGRGGQGGRQGNQDTSANNSTTNDERNVNEASSSNRAPNTQGANPPPSSVSTVSLTQASTISERGGQNGNGFGTNRA